MPSPRCPSDEPVTVADICSVHHALMGDDPIAGRLRTAQNWIGTWDSTPPSAVFVPPPPRLVPELHRTPAPVH